MIDIERMTADFEEKRFYHLKIRFNSKIWRSENLLFINSRLIFDAESDILAETQKFILFRIPWNKVWIQPISESKALVNRNRYQGKDIKVLNQAHNTFLRAQIDFNH